MGHWDIISFGYLCYGLLPHISLKNTTINQTPFSVKYWSCHKIGNILQQKRNGEVCRQWWMGDNHARSDMAYAGNKIIVTKLDISEFK